jgi:hypothetical protein
MDIECKAGKHFYNVDRLRECIKRCDTCIDIPPIRSKPIIYTCPFCHKKSLFTYTNHIYYECLNDNCLNNHVRIAYRHQLLLQIEAENNG